MKKHVIFLSIPLSVAILLMCIFYVYIYKPTSLIHYYSYIIEYPSTFYVRVNNRALFFSYLYGEKEGSILIDLHERTDNLEKIKENIMEKGKYESAEIINIAINGNKMNVLVGREKDSDDIVGWIDTDEHFALAYIGPEREIEFFIKSFLDFKIQNTGKQNSMAISCVDLRNTMTMCTEMVFIRHHRAAHC